MIPKFRAWEPDVKYMNDQVRVTSNRFGSGEVWVEAIESFGWIELKPEHLMQSIGLKDKNGVEIFEGDIVQYRDGEYSYLGIVKRDCYQFFIDGIEPDDNYDFIDVSNTFDGTSSLEIIGNIHENPELLEGN
ncbi:YopX family protein [Enterococcus sp. DIV2438]|uniref:YopX family protein n=1 Tax=unclassified Enterococcus TaxID=2608891 RepID=UPI003D2FD088